MNIEMIEPTVETLHEAGGVPELPELPEGYGLYTSAQMRAYGEQCALAALAARPLSGGWVSVETGLPEHGQSVALIDVNRWENTGGDLEMNVRACGYLSNWGGGSYWSIRGERATELKAFTHWMPLPAPPAGTDEGGR